MLDQRMRRFVAGPLGALGTWGADAGVSPLTVTAIGSVLGIGACVAVAARWWWLGLALWLANRLADGLDGAVARRLGPSDVGGYLDVVSDFVVYGGFVVGVAVAVPGARLACAALLAAYYSSATAWMAWSTLAERRARVSGDGRTLPFVGGLAEGTETIVAYCVVCVVPDHAAVIVWVFCAAVAVTAVQRVVGAVGLLRLPA